MDNQGVDGLLATSLAKDVEPAKLSAWLDRTRPDVVMDKFALFPILLCLSFEIGDCKCGV